MNLIRSIISVFMVLLLAVSVAGWMWAGGQPSPTMEGARLVLALCGLASIGGLGLLLERKTTFNQLIAEVKVLNKINVLGVKSP